MKKYLLLLFGLHTLFTFGQFPEGFETTVPPTGWTTFIGTNGLGITQNWQVSNIANTGAQSAYCRYENVSGGLTQDWLVTPQFTPTGVTNILTFMQRQSYTTNYGSVYKVFISTASQNIHADFTLVDTQTEADFTYYYTEKQIDLSAYEGVPIYVAFVLEQDDGDNWLIDDVALTTSASCLSPDQLSGVTTSTDEASLSWNEVGTATLWQIEYGVTGYTQGTGTATVTGDNPFNITGLSDGTSYDFYVRSICQPGDTSSWVGPSTFTTLAAPITPNYLNAFSVVNGDAGPSFFPGELWSEASGTFLDGPSGTTSNWQSDNWINTSGDTSAKVNLYFSNTNDWLVSPDFDLSGANHILDLDAGVTEWNLTSASAMGSDDQVDLLISTDYGTTWSSIYQWNASNTPSNTGTALPTIDLSSYNGVVRFALLASDGTVNDIEDYDFFIDNFRITGIPSPPDLVITEIMYNSPEAGTDTLEFIELYNNGTSIVDLTGFSFSQGVTHTFTGGSIAPGAYFVIAYSADSYLAAFGAAPDVEWTSGGLSNGGEDIILIDTYGQEIDVVDYDDSGVWPSGSSVGMPDGGGSSIVICDATSDNNDGANWSTSTNTSGIIVNGFELLASPGAQNGNSTTDVINACDSYTWIDGNTYTQSISPVVNTNHLVETVGMTFSPNTLNIYVGDTVTFVNTGGNHNVNGTTATFPNNPESFGNSVGQGWTYVHVFGTAGNYDYHCDPHAPMMSGTITVSPISNVTHVIPNSAGCDSTVTLDLTLTNSNTGTDVVSACDSYTWIDGNTYTSSNNNATWLLTNSSGCDSLVTLDLSLTNSSTGTDTQSACDSYTWIDGNTYTASNNSATHVLTNAAGCDSTVTLDLTITNSDTGTDTQTACDSYTWIDGNTYTSSNNSATWLLTNSSGCDSLVTLDLSLTNSSTGTDTQSACDSYTWIDGNTYTSSNNSATWLLTNSSGCDSLVTLDLSLTNSSTGTDIQSACDSYTWIDGVTYTESNNSATFLLSTTSGCDSLVTLNLTIANSITGTDVINACDSYTWIDGITYTESNFSATQLLTAVGGCDSTVTLNLTIGNSSTGTDVINACDPYTWIDGNTYTSSNNSATWLLTNSSGCDSTVTLNLTINSINTAVTVVDDNTLEADDQNATYQWLDCNDNYSAISGETNSIFTTQTPGDYAVELTVNGCADTSICYTITDPLGIQGLNDSFEVTLYPNPTFNTITWSFIGIEQLDMELFDLQGKLLMHQNGIWDQDQMSLEELVPGSYLIRVKSKYGNREIRLVKQ